MSTVNDVTDLDLLEKGVIIACIAVGEYTVKKRSGILDIGKDCSPTTSDFKGGIHPSAVLTDVDIHNQESILSHMGALFPSLYITVEENMEFDKQSVVQRRLYGNRDVSKYLLSLDAIDGTFIYAYTSRDDYAVCIGILERSGELSGIFRRAIFYYPEQGRFLIARGLGVVVWKDAVSGVEEPVVRVENSALNIENFQSNKIHGEKKFGFKLPFVNDGLAIVSDIFGLIDGSRSGYVFRRGKLIDSAVGIFMLECLGFYGRYEDGSRFGDVMWGDTVHGAERSLARMPDKLFISASSEKLYDELLMYISKNRSAV